MEISDKTSNEEQTIEEKVDQLSPEKKKKYKEWRTSIMSERSLCHEAGTKYHLADREIDKIDEYAYRKATERGINY